MKRRQYNETKKIFLNKKKINDHYLPILEYVKKQFNIMPINIEFDTYKLSKKYYSRLSLILKCNSDYESLINRKSKNGIYDIWDSEQINQLKEVVLNDYDYLIVGPRNNFNIICYDFSDYATNEIYKKAGFGLDFRLKRNNKDIWKIVTEYNHFIIFFYHEYQKSAYIESDRNDIQEICKKRLKKYDFINLFNTEEIRLLYDTKDHLDYAFEGSLFNYWKR
jgi:hypothetical protein